ncbi:uncharacterized protein RB166_010452 isoform 2-T2 [Leptodactylus fuscus]
MSHLSGKLFKRQNKPKNSKKKKSKKRRVNSAPPVSPMYDTVAEVPLYSVVDKSRKKNVSPEDNVQYAEIEVVRRPAPQKKSQKKPASWQQPPEATEYATINFNPQENHTGKNALVNQNSSAHHSRSAGQSKPGRRYNSVGGTLV